MALPAFDELMVEQPVGLPAFEELEPETSALPSFDELQPISASPEVVQQEAQRATVGALQAVDVMAAPRSFDWSEVNEQLDAERFREAEGLRAQGQPERAEEILATITPYTQAGQYVASQRAAAAQSAQNVAATAERSSTPSSVLSGFMGPGLSATVLTVAESAGRSAGPAIGGAIGAARFIPHPGANALAQFLLPMAGALAGAQVGGAAQETVLRTTETPEETVARQQRAAEDFRQNPGLTMMGSAVANLPFFRPGLAQFGRAASGDIGAIRNLGVAATLGGTMEVIGATARGEAPRPEDVAAGAFINLVLNEPTRLGRRLGLQPSSEQRAAEEAQARYAGGVPPLARGAAEPSRTTISDVIPPAPLRESISSVFPPRETPPIPLRGEPELAPEVLAHNQAIRRPVGGVTLDANLRPATDNIVYYPDRAYRTLGRGGYEDFLSSGELRAKQGTKQAYEKVYFNKGTVDARYARRGGDEFIAEALPAENWTWDAGRKYLAPPRNLTADDPVRIYQKQEDGSYRVVFDNITPAESNAQQISETGTPDGGVRPPQAPLQNEQVSAAQSGEGVQPSGQGKPLAQGTPEAPREVVAPEGVRYDGVTQMGDEGFYSFSDTTSIPGRTVSITIESTIAPTPEQIRTAMDAKLAEFRGAETPKSKLADIAPEGVLYRSEKESYDQPGEGAIFFSGDKSYVDLYHGEGRVFRKVPIPENVLDIREPAARQQMREWTAAKIAELEDSEVMGLSMFLRDAKRALDAPDSPQSVSRAMSNVGMALDKIAGRGITPGRAEKAFMQAVGVDAMTVPEYARRQGDEYSVAFRENPTTAKQPISPQPQTGAAPAPPSSGEPAARVGEEPPAPPAEPPTAGRASEAPPELPGATSNKEAVVNAERAARELDPVIKEARISNSESIDRAQQVIQQNPLKPQEIVTRLRDNPHERTISLEDSAVLLVERARLNKTRQELLTRATDETLDPTERAAAKAEFNTIETQLNALDQAAQDARSTWGRFGQLHQRMIREDFTLAALERRARLEKGEPLTPEEAAQVKTIADEVAAEQVKADAAVAAAEVRQIEKGVDEVISTSAKQPELEPAVKSLADRIMARLDAQAEAARSRLRERFKSLGSAPDPLILADFTVIAATRIAKSAIKVSQWVSEMVREFGEASRPYLVRAYEAASARLDDEVAKATSDRKKRATVKAKVLAPGQQQDRVSAAIAARVKEGESLDSLGNYIDKLTDAFIAGGIRDRQSLVAAVKGVLEPLSPGVTDRRVGELISGYGRATTLSKDPLKVIKRDLKGQLQQVSKLEALAAKEPLKKTGPERRAASDEERRLIKQVNEAKKAAGVATTDPETQLKSTMDSARTRFANEIKDLTFQIETGMRPPNRTPVEYDQDILVMRGLRDRLKETVQLLDGPRQLTEEQRIRITTRALQDSIAAIEKRLAGQQPSPRRAAPDTPEIRVLRAKREALRQELSEMESADALLRENRKAEALVRSIEAAETELAGTISRPGRQQGPESEMVTEARAQLAQVRAQLQAKRDADPLVQQERMDAAEAAVEKAIRKLDEQLQAGDISVQRRPTPAGSQRLEDLRMQRDAMLRLRQQLRNEARPKPNPLDVAIKARKSALLRQETDYQARIAVGDFAPRTRKPPIDLSSDPTALDALARVQAVKDKFAKLQREWELKNRTRTEKILGGIKQTWDAVRNLKLSMDLSAPLQTAFAMAAHPIEAGRALGKGVRAFAEQLTRNSDAYARRIEQEIVNSPNNKNGLYKAMKLDLSEVTGTRREENAGSILERLADLESRWQDIPDFVKGLIGMQGQPLVRGAKGIAKALPKVIGMSIKASNAGFGAIANHMRARTADAMLARWYRRRGAPTKDDLELLGNQINAATGKGGLRGEEGIRALLFAPNYYLSILKQLTFQPVIKAGIKHRGAAAREILEEYVRAAATATTMGMLVWLFGNREKQTLDPRSPNFARAMTDRGTSVDFTMGRGAWATLGAQIATGQRVNRQGRVEKQDRSQAFLTFLKGRLSREISTGLTTAFGLDFKGKPVSPEQMAKDLVAPLSWQDVDKVLKREGLTRGTFIQMLNLLGVTHRLSD